MRNLIPERIIQNMRDKKFKDNFKCFSMFVDVSGFTKTTEALMKHGQEGAEVLSDILNYLFETTVAAVYDHGGYVTKYAGDAFTALFEIDKEPEKVALNVLNSAQVTNKFFNDNKTYKSKFGEFEFGVKVGLAYGDCRCGVVGSSDEKTYYFSGSAVDLCAMAEHNSSKGEIWISETIYPFLKDILLKTEKARLYDMDFYKVEKTKVINPESKKYKTENFDKKVIWQLAGKLESEFPVGEFRDVISVFISFSGKVNLEKLMSALYELKETYGASHPVIDFGDKGGNILLFFGAPISYENNSYRALMFMLKLREYTEKKFDIRAGLAKGVVYCGFNGSDLRNEFTCLGNTVNQSARFMMQAEWGQILTDKDLSSNENFLFRHLADIQYKGREGLIPTYILQSKAEIKDIFFKESFIGREKERNKLKKYILSLSKGKNCGVIYIDGEAGMGKSRLTNQIRQDLSKEYKVNDKPINWFYFSCDEIIKGPYNPFMYFFNRFFNFAENFEVTNTEKFEAKMQKIMSFIKGRELKNDLAKYKDYLSFFLGLKVSNSDILAEEPNERQNSVILGLINFFNTFCEYSPLVFEVDNASFIDQESLKLFSRISVSLRKSPVVIIFNTRLKDNGELYDFRFVKQRRIFLKSLNKTEFKDLVKDRLKIKTVPKDTLTILDEKSRRNPLYLEQIVIYLKDNEVLDSKSRIKDLSNIPNGINQIILARVDKLQNHLKDILKTASCIGNEIPFDIISRLYRDKYPNINKFLIELENEDILILFTEISYLFKYAVIRDVIYEMQLKKTVREIHGLIGEAVEVLHNEILDKYYSVLAYHYENAENLHKALEYHKKAGFQSKNNYQNAQALYHFDHASNLLCRKNNIEESKWAEVDVPLHKEDISEFIEINLERFHFNYAILQDIQKSSNIIEVISELAECTGNKLLISKTLMEKSLILANKGNYEESNQNFKMAIELFEALKLPLNISLAYINLGKNHMMVGQMDKATEYYNRGFETAKLIEDESKKDKMIAKLYGDLGIVNDYSGNFDKALEFYNMQLAITEKLNLKIEKATALGNIGVVYHLTGNLNKAKEYYEQKLKLSEELGRRIEIAQILNNIGFLYKDLNNPKKAITYHKKSYSISSELSDYNTMASASINLGHVYKMLKNYPKSEAEFKKGIEISRKYAFKYTIAEGMIELSDLYYLTGDKNSASDFLHEGLAVAEEIGFAEYIEKGKQYKEKIFSEQ